MFSSAMMSPSPTRGNLWAVWEFGSNTFDALGVNGAMVQPNKNHSFANHNPTGTGGNNWCLGNWVNAPVGAGGANAGWVVPRNNFSLYDNVVGADRQFSISTWIYQHTVLPASTSSMVIAQYTSGGWTLYNHFGTNRYGLFKYDTAGTGNSYRRARLLGSALTLNTWNHLYATNTNNGFPTLYLNGALASGTTTVNGLNYVGMGPVNSNIHIGGRQDPVSWRQVHHLWQTAIWVDYAGDASDAAWLYNSGMGRPFSTW